MSGLTCRCGAPFVGYLGEEVTSMGFFSPPGHRHDVNCRKREYVCSGGHRTVIAKVRRCNDATAWRDATNPACDWTGKRECFCCKTFVDEWPAIEVAP